MAKNGDVNSASSSLGPEDKDLVHRAQQYKVEFFNEEIEKVSQATGFRILPWIYKTSTKSLHIKNMVILNQNFAYQCFSYISQIYDVFSRN